MWLHQQFSLTNVEFMYVPLTFFSLRRSTLDISDCTRTVTVLFSITLKSKALSMWYVLLNVSGPLKLMVLVNGTRLPRTTASVEPVLVAVRCVTRSLFCSCLIFNLNVKTLLSDNNTCFYLCFLCCFFFLFFSLLRVMFLSAVQPAIVNFHPGINFLTI